MDMKYWLLFGSLWFISLNGFTQSKLNYQEACADIDYYFATIDSIHPNMYWHTPKYRIDSFKMAVKKKCVDSVMSMSWVFF